MSQNIMHTCPFCNNIARMAGDNFVLQYDCPLCGHYKILSRVLNDLGNFPKHILSGVARNYWETQQERFYFSAEVLQSMESFSKACPSPIPDEANILAKAELVLRYLKIKSNYPGEYIEITPKTDYAVSYSKTYQEFVFCYEYLIDQKLLMKHKTSGERYQITPSGWAYLSGIGVEAKDQGFIAMAFKPELKPVSDSGISPGIENAGYKPLRIDSKDHNNRIDDEIVAEIRKSRFVVADLTGNNQGAYFEAGFAKGLGKPVFWTCAKTQLDAKDIHFDVRQYSIITWESHDLTDFVKRLTKCIEATIGRGRYVPEEREKRI